MEVIDYNQLVFLLLCFILDNLLLIQETMVWAETSGQPLKYFPKTRFFQNIRHEHFH
jgi:hypothetical protein